MKRPSLGSLTLNQKLALGALALGLLAVPARPYADARVTLDTRELAMLVEAEADHVTPLELADWIVQGRADHRLVDLRDQRSFAGYHIPTAENVPLSDLAAQRLPATETLVVYSDGGTHGAQAWLLLKARGLRAVYNLKGGLEGWKDEVLFPVFPVPPAPDKPEYERQASLSRHFGGTPRIGAEAAAAALALPTPQIQADPALAPALPGDVKPLAKKKKKEGC